MCGRGALVFLAVRSSDRVDDEWCCRRQAVMQVLERIVSWATRSKASDAGWLALYVLAVPWRHCWSVLSHLSDSGGTEVVGACLLLLV